MPGPKAHDHPQHDASSIDRLGAEQEQLCSESSWDFSDLRALFVNCTLKRSPERSHTRTRRSLDRDHEAQRRRGRRDPCR